MFNVVIFKPDNELNILSGYYLIFAKISEYLDTDFSTKIKNNMGHKKCTFLVFAYMPKSKNKIIEYFGKFPLLGKVSLDYEL